MTAPIDRTPSSDKNKSTVTINPAKFAAYVAAGTAVSLGFMGEAEADITVINVGSLLEDKIADDGIDQHIRLLLGDSSSFNVDFAHSAGASPVTDGFAITGGNLLGGLGLGIGAASVAGQKIGNLYYASNLGTSIRLNSVTNWINGNQHATMAFYGGFEGSQFLDAGTGFVGLRYNNGSGFSYGWVRVTMNGPRLNSFTVEEFAYGDAGDEVFVGEAIPEPGSLACLALGAVGLQLSRRRKRNG